MREAAAEEVVIARCRVKRVSKALGEPSPASGLLREQAWEASHLLWRSAWRRGGVKPFQAGLTPGEVNKPGWDGLLDHAG